MAETTFAPGAPAGFIADSVGSGMEQGQSMMARAQQMRQAREMQEMRRQQHNQQMAESIMLMPVKEAQTRADLVKMKTELDVAKRTQENRVNAYSLYDQATRDFEFINLITNEKARAQASREWLGRYSQLENIKEINPQVKQMNELATRNITGALGIAGLGSAEMRAFGALTENMSPDEVDAARRVKLGLSPRKSGAAIQYKTVIGPNGEPQLVAVDPREVGAQVIGTGQTFGSGVSETPESVARAAGRPVSGGETFRGPTTEDETRAKESGKLKAERQAAFPKRRAALEKINVATDRLIDDIDSAIGQVNASTAGPGGAVLGVFPGTSARDLQANLDTIVANVGFEALNAMREASKTGGALGNVTEKELDFLQATLASLKTGQSPSQLIANLKKARKRIAENSGAAQRAFESEYGGSDGKEPTDSAEPIKVGGYTVRVK